MTKQCIEKKISDIDYQRLFPDISSPANIWNELDDKSDEEESISKYCTLYSDHICFVISILWNRREKHINTDYSVTGWMLCVIPHIREDVFKNAKNNHHTQVNTVIKSFFLDQLKKSYMKPLISSGANIQISVIIIILLTVMNLSGTVNILVMVTFIYGIRNTLYHPPKFLVL